MCSNFLSLNKAYALFMIFFFYAIPLITFTIHSATVFHIMSHSSRPVKFF